MKFNKSKCKILHLGQNIILAQSDYLKSRSVEKDQELPKGQEDKRE